jgi:two-component system, NtrC family, nitrogen regulation sensor histidine kinase GlnL
MFSIVAVSVIDVSLTNSKCGLSACQLPQPFLLSPCAKSVIFWAGVAEVSFSPSGKSFVMSPDKSKEQTDGLNPAGLASGNLACGVFVVDAHKRITACTPGAAAHLRLDAATLLDAAADSLPPSLAKMIHEVATGGKPMTNREISLDDATTLRANILPVKSEIVVVLDNFPAAPVFGQNMKQLDRLANLGALSAGMAHEIKNGMVAIKTFVELLVEKGQDAELNEVVGRELKRIDGIVTQMLRLASPRHAAFTTVRAHQLLDHSLRLVEHQINGKLISLQRHYHAQTDAVRGDDAQLQQAFMNLLFNAIEAMGANGALTVGTEIVNGENGAGVLRIKIQDTGVGIAPENRQRLFEPFFTTKKNGTGLGLAITRRIVLEHHGAIEVESETGKGSTFSISLPVSQ